MNQVLTLLTNRAEYEIGSAVEKSITVGELIGLLRMYAPSMPVVFSNDNGYTYGYVNPECLEVAINTVD